MIDSNPFPQHSRNRVVPRRCNGGSVILKPRQPPRSVHPEPSQESELPHGCADVRRKPRARGQHQEHLARRCVKPRRDEHDGADVPGSENRPGHRVPECGCPPGGSHELVPTLPRRSPLCRQPVSDAYDAHSLPWRRRRSHVEQMTRQADCLCSTLLGGPLDLGSPCRSPRSEEHTSELQSRLHLVCRLLLEKKKKHQQTINSENEKTQNKEEHRIAAG